jgi:hypothetical protein
MKSKLIGNQAAAVDNKIFKKYFREWKNNMKN